MVEFIAVPDGHRIAVSTLGDASGEPLLVLPGGPCRDGEYLGDLAGLSETRHLAVIHLRGTSATGGLSRGWWNDAADVLAVADSLGLDSFDLLAHSAGTRLALSAAAHAPGRVRTMTLVTPAAAWLTGAAYDGPAIAARRKEPELLAAIASMDEPRPTDEAGFQRQLQIEAPAGYAQWTPVEREHATVGRTSLASVSAWFSEIPQDASQQILEASLPPTLVVGGSEDILSGVEPVQAYAEAIGARLTLLEGCGHYPWVEQPAEFRNAVVPWISSAPTPR